MNQINAGALVICINYGASASAVEFLRSIGRLQLFENVSVVIGDNSSGDDHLVSIRRAISVFSNVELLESSSNRGYFGAARFVFDRYLAKGEGLPDWVIVCNHDVVIEDKEFFAKLFAQDSSSVGVLAPRITIPSQSLEQNPFMKERPGWWRRFTMRLYSSAYPLGVMWDWLSRQKKAFKSLIPVGILRSQTDMARKSVYAAHGAFLIFSRRFFEAGGKFDEQLFLFGEEISVAETCRTLGLPVVYEPSLAVLHNEHQSVGNGMSRQMFGYHRASVQHLFSKYLT